MKRAIFIIIIIIFILLIGVAIYTNIRLYKELKDDHKSIDWECVIWCISLFLMEMLLVLSIFINK